MKPHMMVAVVSGLLFFGSFFLPAYGDDSGFMCYVYCLVILLKHEFSFGWPYYAGFTLTNFLFVPLFVGLPFWKSRLCFRLWASVIALVHVGSWLVLNAKTWFFAEHGSPYERFDLKIGYFVWLLAYALLFWGHILAKKELNQSPPPLTPPPAAL